MCLQGALTEGPVCTMCLQSALTEGPVCTMCLQGALTEGPVCTVCLFLFCSVEQVIRPLPHVSTRKERL